MTVREKIAQLRKEMSKQRIDAFVIYTAGPHMSEYLPDQWKERVWLSGFTGSYGWVVVTQDKAGLWTDGRYFTQAAQELKDTGITMYKDRVVDAINYADWLVKETPEGATVAVNALVTAHTEWETLQRKLEKTGRKLIHQPLLDTVWVDRGEPVRESIYAHPIERSGKSVANKVTAIRNKMKEYGASTHIITSLDDVAWTVNLRGSDVECNPVFMGYLIINRQETLLFVEEDKLTEDACALLKASDVKTQSYASFFTYIESLKEEKVLISPTSNQAIFETLKANNSFVVQGVPGNLMKAIKNSTELAGFRTVMVRDGVAMVKFLYWLTHQAGKEPMTEYSIAKKLHGFRSEGKNFVGESFATIVGYQGNGAIIHYSPKEESSAEVTNKGSILVDSGGQYLEGTTDITRTFPLGEVSEGFKHDYTLVLKAYIQLAMAKFPKGTYGAQLDILARLPLWKEGKDYNHGTGHGVGSFLNVHEGPQAIRKEFSAYTLVPGMVLSNEPGYYIENKYGIRHENLMAVREWEETTWNHFYDFETLTFCPFFKSPIVKELLSSQEITWFNKYHKTCEEKLAPLLEGEVKEWFLELVKPL